ncbi:MAG: hypothetical protein AAFQ21_02640 [Pseudomonadota bacterium]
MRKLNKSALAPRPAYASASGWSRPNDRLWSQKRAAPNWPVTLGVILFCVAAWAAIFYAIFSL